MKTEFEFAIDYIRRGRSYGLGPMSLAQTMRYVNAGSLKFTYEDFAFGILEGEGIWDVYKNGAVVFRLI